MQQRPFGRRRRQERIHAVSTDRCLYRLLPAFREGEHIKNQQDSARGSSGRHADPSECRSFPDIYDVHYDEVTLPYTVVLLRRFGC